MTDTPETSLAIALLADPTASPLLSLVAEHDSELAGHVLFTAVTLPGYSAPIQIMAPLAVASRMHKQGIGTQLIEAGLQQLRERGTSLVLVYGDPDYYARAGFLPGHAIEAPCELEFPHGWLAQELTPGALKNARGKIRCADALSSPEYW